MRATTWFLLQQIKALQRECCNANNKGVTRPLRRYRHPTPDQEHEFKMKSGKPFKFILFLDIPGAAFGRPPQTCCRQSRKVAPKFGKEGQQ